MMKLRKYQEKGVDFLKHRKYAMIADEMGLGKTAQAIMALPRKSKVLIICPATAKIGWKNQFQIWVNERNIQIINSSKDKLNYHARVVIVNYDLIGRKDRKLFKVLMNTTFTHIVCDEAHRLKNPKAARAKRTLDKRGLIRRTDRMWFLTGTPMKNRPIDLFYIINSTMPELLVPFNSYLKFAYRFCAAYEDGYGLDVSGCSNAKDLEQRVSKFMIRREIKDVLNEMPEVSMNIIELQCSSQGKKLIKREEQKTKFVDEDGEESILMGEAARIRQTVAKYKLPQSVQFIKDTLEEVDKVVIFYWHTSVLDELTRKLKDFNPVSISGKTTPNKRQGIVDEFVNDKDVKVFIGQIVACGEALDGLQHGTNTCIFVEPSWSSTDMDQCIGRLRRMDVIQKVSAYILVIEDTIEAQMMKTIKWKKETEKKLIKPTKEKMMSLEKQLERLNDNLEKALPILEKLVHPQIMYENNKKENPEAVEAQEVEKPKKKKATKKTTKKKRSKKSSADIESVRALAKKICVLQPDGVGKGRCTSIIEELGAEKLDRLDPEGLEQASVLFQQIIEELEDVDV